MRNFLLLIFLIACSDITGATENIQIVVDPTKPGPTISKNLYGQFAEHLGTGIYGGMWVGPNSTIPNTRGWRNDVITALRNLHVPLVRWPGGCFADEYHWQDGIGPRASRPVRSNGNWGGVERNAVGTHEFFDLVDLIGADAYINGNLGSGTVQEMADWLEYMTSDAKSTLANLRRQNGHDKPFKIAYFAVGNEAWGCGGNMSPEFYVNRYNQNVTFLRMPASNRPRIIASGGTGDETTWTEVLGKNLIERTDAVSFHYYTLPTGKWDIKGSATGFGEDQWISTLANTLRIDALIKQNVDVLDKFDPAKKLGFDIDEWGTWYDTKPGESALYQENTLRDAMVAALNFNIFHAHADRVRLANIAQMVNVLQAMIQTRGSRLLLTPTYHVFKMYAPFQDAVSLPITLSNNPDYARGSVSIPAVSASAARSKDGKLYLALTNADPSRDVDVTVNIVGVNVLSIHGSRLTADSMDSHNTFDNPNAVHPVPVNSDAGAVSDRAGIHLPAKSIVVVEMVESN